MRLKGFKKSDGSLAKIYTDPTLTESDSPADAASVKAKDDQLEQKINANTALAEALDERVDELEAGAPSIIAPKVTEWLNANVDPTGSAVTVDSSLTIAGSAADAKKTGDELSYLKSDLNKNSESIFSGDSIEAIKGVKVTETGYVSNPSGYWRGLILPLDVCLVDGKITTLITGLSGSQNANIYATLYFDGDHKFISGSYTVIPVNNSISESDIPTGTKYVGFNYGTSEDSLFRIKSNTNITRIKKAEDIINEQLIYGSRYEIPLYFGSVTGYWNSSRTFTTYSGIQAAKVNVSNGETYYLTSKNYYGMARVAFFDSSDAIISVIYTGSNTSLVENTKVVVPQNASYMLIQRYGTNDCFMWKCDLAEHLSVIDSDIENIKEVATSEKTENVSLTFESATGFYTNTGSFSEYDGVTTASVPVSVGEEYLLNSRDYYSAAMVVFFDSNNSFISAIRAGTGTTARNNYRITVPNGASKMLIQRVYTYRTTLRKIIGIQAKPVSSILNGKNITIIGDSITEKNVRAMTNWADYFADWCGANVQNLGASGTGFIAGGNNPYSNRISRIGNPDIIGVACSFNDMSNSVEDLTTAAESFFDALITAYPSIPIICYVQSPWSAYHYGIETSDAWVNALRDVCQNRGVPFYDDMYKGSALKPWLADNRAVYYMNDGEGSTGEEDWVHPNSEGHKIIARHLYPKFAENLVAVGLDYGI